MRARRHVSHVRLLESKRGLDCEGAEVVAPLVHYNLLSLHTEPQDQIEPHAKRMFVEVRSERRMLGSRRRNPDDHNGIRVSTVEIDTPPGYKSVGGIGIAADLILVADVCIF